MLKLQNRASAAATFMNMENACFKLFTALLYMEAPSAKKFAI